MTTPQSGSGKKSHRNGKKITRKDIHATKDLPLLIRKLAKRMKEGDAEVKELSAAAIVHIAQMDRGAHAHELYKGKAVKPLVGLLSGGSANAQSNAACALAAIAVRKAEHQKAIVDAGGGGALVGLLKTGSAKVQEEAANALAALNADVLYQAEIIKAGAIPALVAVIKSGSAAAQASAAQATANAAAFGREAQKAITKAGAIPLLLTLLGVGKAQKPAAAALAKLAHANPEIQGMISDAGGIAPLLALLNGLDVDVQVQAAAALAEMARDNAETQSAISKAGGIGPLLALIGSRSGAAQSYGMAAIAQLARNNRDNQDTIARMDGIRPLVLALESNDEDAGVVSSAAFAIMEVSRANASNQRFVVDNGGVSQLATLMKSNSHAEVKAEVAGALWSLSEDPEIKVSIAAAGTIAPLVSLLGEGASRAQHHSSGALASLGLNNRSNQVHITQMLIELLSSGTQLAQERAAHALWELVKENPNEHDSIAKAGNPAALVELLKSGISDAKDYAIWSLSLSISADNQTTVAESGGVQPLIDQLANTRPVIQEQAAAALAKLARDNGATRSDITKQGGVRPLIMLLNPQESESGLPVPENAVDALANLASEPAARDEIVSSGGIPPLVRILESEGRNSKQFAATALARLSKDHELTQSAIAKAGAIKSLVELLDGKEGPEAQEAAASAILALAETEANRLIITDSGGIGELVMLLGSNNPRAREHAEGALVRLSIENANRVLIIKKLVDMLQDPGAGGQEQAAAALANLARESEDNRQSIVDADGISPLIELLETASAKAKENAVSAIKELCRNSKNNQHLVAKAGGIAKLVGVLGSFSANTMKETTLVQLITLAASAIKEMAKDNRFNQDAITEAGAIQPLVTMLTAPAAQMQANAAGALANLANNHTENQGAIARTGAVAPLCSLIKEGSDETKDESALAIWSLATNHPGNKDTIAKLGGIDPLLGLLVTGTTETSQEYVSGALTALAAKHVDNRQVIAKRLVGLLGSSAVRTPDRAERVLRACASFCSDSAPNQATVAKLGGIPPLLAWLAKDAINNLPATVENSKLLKRVQARAALAMLCLAADNSTTQSLIAKSDGIPPLIALVKKSSPEAQQHAACALWHLASQAENRAIIVDAGGVKPLISMLAAEDDNANELAAIILVRLARGNPDVSSEIAEKAGVLPLVKLLSTGSPGSQQQAASCLAELALVSKNRDIIANANGIEPTIQLLTSTTVGTPEVAARILAHLAFKDDEKKREAYAEETPRSPGDIKGSDERRSRTLTGGGIGRLISMLSGSHLPTGAVTKPLDPVKGLSQVEEQKMGVKEQAAVTLAEIAHNNHDMQDAIIHGDGVPPLLACIRMGSQLGQEHAARAIWHLAALTEAQCDLVSCGAIPDLIQLLKIGSMRAQEMAAAGISDLALGAVQERQTKEATEGTKSGVSAKPVESGVAADESTGCSSPTRRTADSESDRLVYITEQGGIMPLVALLSSGTAQARENAAGALWHLALEESNQSAIAKCNGIAPLVTILDDGTDQAHRHAADALARLAIENMENQSQIAKHCVALLANPNTGAQRRAARVLRDLAADNPGSPVVIVNAGAISPLVTLLTTGASEVKEEAAGALATLSFNSPSTQLAIASGLVVLVGTGSAEAQEQVTQLLLRLSHDHDNCVAIAKAGAISRLVVQLRGGGRTSIKAQELAAAVLSYLSALEECVKAITAANGVRPLVGMLTSGTPAAQAHAAAVLSDAARVSIRNQKQIISEGGIAPLVNLLSKDNKTKAKAEAAGALQCLAAGQPATQKAVAEAGAIKALVALLNEDDELCLKKAAGAIAALCNGSIENQDAVEKNKGINKLVGLLKPSMNDEVSAEAAAALAVLAQGNQKNQDKIAAAGGIEPLVSLLRIEGGEHAKEEAALALWSLASKHRANQIAIADADGIPHLVAVLGLGVRAQEQAAGALAALALDNTKNELSIADRIVSLLGSDDKSACSKAARAISRLARAHASNQRSIAKAGGVPLLVRLLDMPKADTQECAGEEGEEELAVQSGAEDGPEISPQAVQKEMAAAIWSMTNENQANQVAIAQAGGIAPLVALLSGHPEVHRDAAGALWALASNRDNQCSIANSGGIEPLVDLLKKGAAGAQETAAGALYAIAETPDNRVGIASAGGIQLLIALFDGGSNEAKEQAALALQTLVKDNVPNQLAIVNEAVAMLKNGSAEAQEHVTQLLRNLAQDPENRSAIAKAGAVPELVRQLECGSEKAMGMAASGLALIALKSEKDRAMVSNELVKLLSSNKEAVRQRAAEALTDMAVDESSNPKHRQTASTNGVPLVNLLKDGLKDGRVEAQEYALRSLLSISDAAAKEQIVEAGCIKPLITCLESGKLSSTAQEHAAAVLSGLAPIGNNAAAIKDARGIDPLVLLLSTGTDEAKGHAAAALAQLARRANASSQIAMAGAVSAFVRWLVDPSLGPPEVAARALSVIALDNPDTQAQIAEEGAISPLVDMVGAWKRVSLEAMGDGEPTDSASITGSDDGQSALTAAEEMAKAKAAKKAVAQALKVANVAAGALSTLAKENIINTLVITEDNGIPPLVELLKHPADAYENPTMALWHLAATEDNQVAIAKAGGIMPLVSLLTSESQVTALSAAAALRSLARDHAENQIAVAKAGAIPPLIDLLGCDSIETQEHAVGALLHLASQDVSSRNAVVQRLVAVLRTRIAAAQMKAAEALAVLAARSDENRKAITAAEAIEPLVRLLGDGKRVRAATPQERAAAVLADLVKLGDNKKRIVDAGAVNPLVAMLSSESPVAQASAAGALWQLAALGSNRPAIAEAGAIKPLVSLLGSGTTDAQKYSTGALWHLASTADNKTEMVNAGAIPLLVAVLDSKSPEVREHAAAVVSALARTQGGNKKSIFLAGGIRPLVQLLVDHRTVTQRHAACALWGLSDGKDGVYDKQIAEAGAILPLIAMLQNDDSETRGFAVACLLCICRDISAHPTILEAGGADLLQALAYGPATWLRSQVVEMLTLLGVPVPDPDGAPPAHLAVPKISGLGDDASSAGNSVTKRPGYEQSQRDTSRSARMKFHFFSFQIAGTTGYMGHV